MAIKDWADIADAVNEKRLLNTLMEMVSIPSPSGEEGRIGRYIGEKCREWGLDVEVKPVIEDRVNVFITLSGREPGPTFLFNGHLDTEPLAPGWTLDPYKPFIKDGFLYGSEATNMKAANASKLEALLTLRETGALKKGKVVITFVAGECDKQGIGTQHIVRDGIKADAALVGEPTNLDVLTAHANPIQLKVTTHGKPAHQAKKEMGICAIQKMIKIINALDDSIITYTPDPDHSMTPRLNVGWIQGGKFPSTTAPSCEIVVDIRAIPGMTVAGAITDLQNVIELVQKADPDVKASVEEHNRLPFGPRAAFSISKEARVVQAANEASGLAQGKNPAVGPLTPHYYFFWTDAGLLMQAGIPTVVCGPGVVDQENIPDERIEVAQIVQAARIYTMVAAEMTQG